MPADRVAGPFTSRAHSASRSAFRGAQRRRRVALLPVCQRAPGEHVAPLFPEGPSAQARLGALPCAFRRGRGSECVDFCEARPRRPWRWRREDQCGADPGAASLAGHSPPAGRPGPSRPWTATGPRPAVGDPRSRGPNKPETGCAEKCQLNGLEKIINKIMKLTRLAKGTGSK